MRGVLDPVWTAVGILAVSPLMAAFLLLRSAPYGRHNRAGWGPVLGARPAWVVMELPGVVVFTAVAVWGGRFTLPGLLLAVLWLGHYAYRSFVYPALMRSSPRTVPLVLVALGFVFNAANAWANAGRLYHPGGWPPQTWLLDPRFLGGLVLYVAGFVLHARTDARLRALRRPGQTGYALPTGGLFRWVAAPNYLGELAQWTGWALASWSLAGVAFAVFTAANLVPRALSHLRWYRATFPDYPARAKAILPGIL